MAAHNELGKAGEKIAVDYLLSKGYKIRHTNWNSGRYELDIVAEKDNMLIVVEVKTRSNNLFGNPDEFVGKAKVKRTIDAAHHYILQHDLQLETRFDIVSIVKTFDGKFNIEHIEDAFVAW
jgi:putative endonuclease